MLLPHAKMERVSETIEAMAMVRMGSWFGGSIPKGWIPLKDRGACGGIYRWVRSLSMRPFE
jgi:hypothetical protein